MRWLVAQPGPNFSVLDVYAGWVEALRELGQQVVEFNFGDRLTFYDAAYFRIGPSTLRKAVSAETATELAVNGLYAALYKTRPDVLLVVSGFLIPAELMDLARRYGTRVVIHHTESPYQDGRQAELGGHADLNLTNDPTNLGLFTTPALYAPHAYRPSVHTPGPAVDELVCDLAFVGTGFASRIALLEAMHLDGLDVLLAGNWQLLDDTSPLRPFVAHALAECLDNAQTVDVYRSARVGLNLYRRESDTPQLGVGWSMGPREIEMAACGLFFLRDHRPEGDALLPMLPTFDSPEEAGELLRWWLPRETQRQTAAAQAREAVADRTFTTNATSLLRLLDQQPVTV